MSAGYSAKPLAEKLGLKRDQDIAVIDCPFEYETILGDLKDTVNLLHTTASIRRFSEGLDTIHLFATEYAVLVNLFPLLKHALHKHGQLWISWPKKQSGLPTDLNEQVIREVGLENGLVDVKVVAVDDQWSALKFVFRLKDR